MAENGDPELKSTPDNLEDPEAEESVAGEVTEAIAETECDTEITPICTAEVEDEEEEQEEEDAAPQDECTEEHINEVAEPEDNIEAAGEAELEVEAELETEPEEIVTNGVEHSVEDTEEVSEFQFNPAFQGAGTEAGLTVWRIEQFEPVKRDPGTFGQFYSGDAYIVLKTVTIKGSTRCARDIHFWLGKDCQQDESGSAALLTVELDEYLGGAAVQHREVQAHESKQFLSYFKKGIRYYDGGVKSGFREVDPDAYEKRLFQCRGKHTIRVHQVVVMCASLNQADVFILDDGPNMYVWNGPKSSRRERIKGLEIARQLRDEEKGGRAKIHIIDDDWNTNKDFFKALGSRDKEIRSAEPDDEAEIVKEGQQVLLYSIFPGRWIHSTDDGKANYIEVSTRPLKKELLDPKNCYVLEAGTYGGVFLWTGKECSGDFKKKAWSGVNHFIDTRGFPEWVSVTRVIDGGESPLFKQYFDEWDEVAVPVPESLESNVAEQCYESVDGETLHTHKVPKSEEYVPEEEGEATLQVWHVDDYQLIPVSKAAYGVFFGGDSYVIQYDYTSGGKDTHIIYFWQGANSTPNEQGSAALHAMRLDDQLGGEAVQIRVVMGKEPSHFLKIFGGRLIVFKYGHVEGFKGLQNHPDYNPGETLLFHVRGEEVGLKAFQVEARGASLNSNDVFFMTTPNKNYVWKGQYSEDKEVELATKMADFAAHRRDGSVVTVDEGKESLSFWHDIGGEESHYTGPKKKASMKIPPRLFHCSTSSGKFLVQAVPEFDQEDLVEEDVMILDTYDEIFIWIGTGASEFEKKESYKTAYTYINSDPTGRTTDNTLIIVVRQGFEPPSFTGHFVPWDADKWNEGKTYADLVAEIGEENAGMTCLTEEAEKYFATYSYDELKRKFPPEGVDVTKRESYLSDDEFEDIFKVTKDAFYAMPKWKQSNSKKRVQLF